MIKVVFGQVFTTSSTTEKPKFGQTLYFWEIGTILKKKAKNNFYKGQEDEL